MIKCQERGRRNDTQAINHWRIERVIINTGATRTVLLVGRWAVKIPKIHIGGWGLIHNFLTGICANIREAQLSKVYGEGYCPVLFAGFGMVVMPRCAPLNDQEWAQTVPMHGVEHKRENYGKLRDCIVATDYE